MNLTDLMSGMNLSLYPQIALVIFLAVFVAVVARTYRRPRGEMDRLARLPMEDRSIPESASLAARSVMPHEGASHE